jgi:hypothetical protein
VAFPAFGPTRAPHLDRILTDRSVDRSLTGWLDKGGTKGVVVSVEGAGGINAEAGVERAEMFSAVFAS